MTKKIKILRIIARLNVGGPAIHAMLLTEALNDGQFKSILVTGEVDNSEKDMGYLARERGINPVVIPELGRNINPIKDLIALWKIYRLIRREKPDVVHTHTAKAGALGRIAAIFAGVPIKIHTFHGNIFQGYFNKLYVKLFILIEKVLAYFTTYIVVVSEQQKKDIGQRYKIAPLDKIKVIRLGLELEKFACVQPDQAGGLRKRLNIDNNTTVIGIVGRLVPVKNHEMLLDAIKQLHGHLNRKFDIKCLIIGDGEKRETLEKYAKTLSLNGDVLFCGWQKDMENIYTNLDIVALTSFNEGTPVTLIEALAAGKPVVATNVGGVSEVVENGVNGYLVSAKDAEKFSECLAGLIENPERRIKFGTKGREVVRKKFSKERLIYDIKNIYEEAAKTKCII